MNVKELIEKLEHLKKEMHDKEIVVYSPNGLCMEPKIKIELYDDLDPLNKGSDNIKRVILDY